MKKIIGLAFALFLAFTISGCGQTKTTSPIISPNPVSTTTENVVNVDIKDFTFTPDYLTVKPGTTVVWTNNDTAAHKIKSATFNSGTLSQGQTFSFTFNDLGTFAYICSFHTSMGGQIIVQ
ncbi:MAG: cupredoxin domain-containing protein [Patescibacteria group bacterium]